MEALDINATVHLSGVDKATEKATALAEKIKEAKTLAGELASLLDALEVEVEM